VAAVLRLVEVSRDRAGLRRFLRVPYRIYRDDPHWVAPLLSDRLQVLGPANPFFTHARLALWLAVRDGRDVGSVAGIVDARHNARHREATAFFGFFESANDGAVSALLLGAVRDWARGLGMTRLLGPMNPSINEECGLLVEGFDAPPVVMMTYNPGYYADLLAAAGLRRCKDLLAYGLTLDDRHLSRLERLGARALQRSGVTVRPVDRRALARDLANIQEVYNAAWEDNWGHVPMTVDEIVFMARRLLPVLDPEIVLVAEAGGQTVGFILALPDVNEVLGTLRGRLVTPRFVLALPYLLKWKRPRYTRVVAMGIRREYRQRGIDAALIGRCLRAMLVARYERCEISWVLDDNPLMQSVGAMFGGAPYKRYALYEQEIGGSEAPLPPMAPHRS
jgi:GNAT superfamily N-acetyltransferase